MTNQRIILGIDPGTSVTGYGIIKSTGDKIEIVALGVMELSKFTGHYLKLSKIFERTLHLIDNYSPTEFAIEAPFFGKNVQSMLKLGRAQGVAIAAALYRNLPINEYSPRKIKMAVTGRGDSSKEQVAAFLASTLNIPELPTKLDATDGLAAAVCHFYQKKAAVVTTTGNSWKDFIKNNPDRVK